MSDIVLRPRSATELVDASFQLYRRDPLQFMVGLGLVYVPWMLVIALSGLTTTVRGGAPPSMGEGVILVFGGLLVYLFSNGVTTVLANDLYFGRVANVGRAFGSVTRHFVQLTIAVLVVALAMVGVTVPATIAVAVSATGLGPFVVFGGVLAIFFLLGLIYTFFFATKQVVLLEDRSGLASLRRSLFLSTGLKWHVFSTLALILLINIAFLGGVMLVAAMIPSQVFQLVVQTLVSVVVYPLLGIAETMLYYDTRIRREGFDIEYLAAMAPPAASSPEPTTT